MRTKLVHVVVLATREVGIILYVWLAIRVVKATLPSKYVQPLVPQCALLSFRRK